MIRISVLLAVAVLAEATVAAYGQGVAPGGPIGNSTGIGSGVGPGAIGTAPSFPNGTGQPTLPPPPPPGGLPPSGRADRAPQLPQPDPHVQMPSRYPQPLDPNDSSTPVPSRLPQAK